MQPIIPDQHLLKLQVQELIDLNFSTDTTQKVKNYALGLFNKNTPPLDVSHSVICKFKHDKKISKELLHFDHQIGKLKHTLHLSTNDDDLCELKENQERLKKWTSYGFDPQIYYLNTDFVDFIFDSYLGAQMKITQLNELREIDGEPALMVEGEWMKASIFLAEFEVKYDPTQYEIFIFKKGTDQVYTYLDTGQGLVPFHLYFDTMRKPISKIDQKSYQTTLESAKKFVREGETALPLEEREEINKDRTCVLQIVSSQLNAEKKHNFLTKNLYQLLNAKHPWIRVIDPTSEGADIFEEGFVMEHNPKHPLATLTGRFRAIDHWEYKPGERIVTNIAITPEESRKLKEYHRVNLEPSHRLGFNMLQQNCTNALSDAIKQTTGIHIPTEISVGSILLKVTPDFFKRFVKGINIARAKTRSLVGRVTPGPLLKSYDYIQAKVIAIFEAAIAFFLSLMENFGGSTHVEGSGRKIGGQEGEILTPGIKQKRYWYDLSLHRFHLPGILQEWQMKQLSTISYDKSHAKLSIVPPAA